MKLQARPQSKIPTTGINTNQKKDPPPEGDMGMDTSLLKKNEFTLIIAGALVVTVLVFFLFFWDTPKEPIPVKPAAVPASTPSEEKPDRTMLDKAMENRLAELEVTVSRLATSPALDKGGDLKGLVPSKGLTSLEQRLDRLETALTLKVDAQIERLNKLERQLADLKTPVAKPAPAKTEAEVKGVTASAPPPPVKPAVSQAKPTAPQAKPAAPQAKSGALFHAVQKGETLYSISKKYNTTVPAVRKLNNMTDQDQIYPGQNLMVR